jgi:hypothetical protein
MIPPASRPSYSAPGTPLKFTVRCFKRSCRGLRGVGGDRMSSDASVENEALPDAEEAAKRDAKREKNRARAAAYRKANAEKRNAYARDRRAALSDAQRLVISQKQKKQRTEDREKYLESVRRTNAKRLTKKSRSD